MGTLEHPYQHNISPTLSIIIVNSDTLELTLNCLNSIYRHHPHEPFEIILVDNFSEISPHQSVKELFPHVVLLSSDQKQGFAKNYNLGIQKSMGEYILVLNNDTWIHPGALNALLEGLRQDPAYGMAGAKLLSSNGNVQSVCARKFITPLRYVLIQFLLDLGLPSGKLIDKISQWKLNRKSSGPIQCISGACMLVKRSALEETGLLDEGYDFYYEDIEWCHRFWNYGFQVAYISEAVITHYGDSSLSKVKVWAKKSEYLSALRYFITYHRLTRIGAWMIWAATVLSYHMRWVVFSVLEIFSSQQGHKQSYQELASWIKTQSPTRLRMFSQDVIPTGKRIEKKSRTT